MLQQHLVSCKTLLTVCCDLMQVLPQAGSELTKCVVLCSVKHGCLSLDRQDFSADHEYCWGCQGLDADWSVSSDVCLASHTAELGRLFYRVFSRLSVQLSKAAVYEEATSCIQG